MEIDGKDRFMMILGIDPGRDKTGWALVNYDGDLFSSGICPVPEQELFLEALALGPCCWERKLSPWVTEKTNLRVVQPEELSLVAVGNGTGSPEAIKLFERLGVGIIAVDEVGTTLEARELYWSLYVPSWRQRCLPRIMRLPPRSLDDLAAWVIAKRSLEVFRV